MLKSELRKIIREEYSKLLKESYYRLEDKKARDLLYTTSRDLAQFTKNVLEHDNDFKFRDFATMIEKLQHVQALAKEVK